MSRDRLSEPTEIRGTQEATEELPLGTEIGGKYRLQQKLGEGGMGSVFRALHIALNLPVALKILSPHLVRDSEFLRRFAREAKAISLIDHPNVVRVLDYGVEAALPFMAMELLQGQSLEDWIALQGLPTLQEVGEIGGAVLSALEAAHNSGIIHRDLKPDNVFLSQSRTGARTVKVVDFGLAHVRDPLDAGPTLTRTDTVAGTPTYMSPEQCRSLAVEPVSDLYSFGCVLTMMLQGTPPFHGHSPAEVMTQQMFSPAPPLNRPAEAEPVPPALERLRLDLLNKDAERRPQPAGKVAQLLRQALDPSSESSRLGTRKGDEPLGTRAERIAQYGFVPTPAQPERKRSEVRAAHIVYLDRTQQGLDDKAITALAVQGIQLDTRAPALDKGAVIILDASNRIEEAVDYLANAKRENPKSCVVVCLAELDAEKMNRLIAAGASDVVPQPIAPEALAKKVDRVLRRRR